MKKNDELASTELQRILLARCNNITVSARTITQFSMERILAFSMERVIAFSIERVLVQNALQLTRNFGVPLAFPQRSISRSICVPVTRSVLGYFCPVLYVIKFTVGSTNFSKNVTLWIKDISTCHGYKKYSSWLSAK